MTIFTIHNFKKYFGGLHALDDISLSFESGKIYGMIGSNGSGKTTLINAISGFINKDKGEISIEINNKKNKIQNIISHKIRNYGITRTFQNVRVFENMSVKDNLLVVLGDRRPLLSLFKSNTKEDKEKVNNILKKLNLIHQKDNLAINLSYGQRKLLEIGRSILIESEVYFFDEPFAGLFPEMVKLVVELLKELRQKNKIVILVEHNIPLIKELCDELIVLDAGKLLTIGKVEEILNKKSVIELYIGE